MTGSVDEAEDLVQETFLRAWRSRTTFEGRAQLSTWLHRIATNVCLDAHVRAGRRGEAVEYFQLRMVGLPEPVVAQLRGPPFRAELETMAHTLVYDATIVGDSSLALDGRALILEDATHDLVPEVLAPPLLRFFSAEPRA